MTLPPNQTSLALTQRDTEHLNALSICWWIVAGLQCLGTCIGIVYVVLAIVFGAGALAHGAGEPAAPIGLIFSCAGIFIIVVSTIVAWLSYLVGKSLRQQRRLMLIYVMAAITCLSFPLGTALGIFTFIVLARPTVKASFH